MRGDKDMRTVKRIASVFAVAVLLVPALTSAAVINWSADIFDADTDVSTDGALVEAYNLGSRANVTVNGVVFAADPNQNVAGAHEPGNNTFFVSGNGSTAASYYQGGAIGSLSSADANALMDSLEYGPGIGTSLARIDGLTIGSTYLVQLIVVRNDNLPTRSFGYSTPSGNTNEIYTLTGVDTRTNPKVITATFVADETVQDIHVASSDTANGLAAAYQVRKLPPPPPRGTLISFF